MANLKSNLLTNIAAVPIAFNNWALARGALRRACGTLEVSTAEDATHILRMVRVRSNAFIHQVLLSCDAIATSGAVDVGVYYADNITNPGIVPGAVLDVDHFGSAVVLTSALQHSDVTHEADPADAGAGYGKADVGKMLWESVGLTVDPACEFDIALTITTDMGGAGTVNLTVTFTVNE